MQFSYTILDFVSFGNVPEDSGFRPGRDGESEYDVVASVHFASDCCER
jgi:hypothetical protein